MTQELSSFPLLPGSFAQEVSMLYSAYFRLLIIAQTCIWSAICNDASEFEIICDQDPDAPVGLRMCYVAGIELSKYNKAKTFCEGGSFGGKDGWTLASIHTIAQNDLVRGMRDNGDIWTGLSDKEDEGNFVWDDGTPYDFQLWSPFDTSSSKHKDFVYMTEETGDWDDSRKDRWCYPVCSRRDVNECEENMHNCDGECHNVVGGGFTCSCKDDHYRLGDDGHTCVDVNECASGRGVCGDSERCENTLGSHECIACGIGYQADGTGTKCVDVNECAVGMHNCEQECNNVEGGGGFTCGCWNNYILDRDGIHCHDVNECASGRGVCGDSEQCKNTLGSHECIACDIGYQADGAGTMCVDVNECEENMHNCDGECHNVGGGFLCSCEEDDHYRLDDDGHTCVDVNECASGRGVCGDSKRCENTLGSHECIECGNGYQADGTGTMCVDVNECRAHGRGVCGDSERCKNTLGSHECIACGIGYQADRTTGTMCVDVNECVQGRDVCGDSKRCMRNTLGAYVCMKECGNGYQADVTGTTCVDIDECEEDWLAACGPHRLCINRKGSYRCKWCTGAGHRLSEDGRKCESTDVNSGALATETDDTDADMLASEVIIGASVACGLVGLVAIAVVAARRVNKRRRSSFASPHPQTSGVVRSTEDNIRASLHHQEEEVSRSNVVISSWGGGGGELSSRSEWMVDNPLVPLPPV